VLHPSHGAALFALVERNGPHQTRIEIPNQRGCSGHRHARAAARVNPSITLSIIGEISCGRPRDRAFIVHLRRFATIRREGREILPCAVACPPDCMPQQDLHDGGIDEFAL